MVEFIMRMMSMLDPVLVFWAIVLNIAGFYIKRHGLPKSAPPLPLILYLLAFVPCFILGWAHADGWSGKAALEAVLYAVSNAGLITLPAVFGYDLVHAVTGKYARNYTYMYNFSYKCNIKVSTIVYSVTTFVAFVASGLVAFFAFHESVIYSLCWAVLFTGASMLIARVILHEVYKVADLEDYAIDAYVLFAILGWLGLILTGSWLGVSLFGAILVGSLLLAFFTRFMDPVEETEAEEATEEEKTAEKNAAAQVQTKELKKAREADETELEFLQRTVRFRFVDDNLDGAPVVDQPLCEVGDDALTVNEADARGFGAIAGEGIEYLKHVLRKRDEKKEV